MKFGSVILIVVLSVLASSLTSFYIGAKPAASLRESTYDRVMRTKTIRCGYAAWPPLLIKDPNSGKLSGVFYDYMQAVGKALNLKIEWSEEMGWGDFPAALSVGRVDAFCAGAWPNASRASQIDFTVPISFQAIYAYVRADDKRFDNNLAAIGSSATIVGVDGEMAMLIANRDFPQAKSLQIPELSGASGVFLSIVSNKGDVTFTDPITAGTFDAANPGKIRRVATKTPLRVFGNPLAIARGQDDFRRMIDTTTEELLYNGDIEKILKKYETFPGTMLRVLPGYQVSAAQ
ncbi:MAG TPA: transporter substrate-binding domain-containing protein [Alphaproteobacteria bacterium]|nr:transporter substrate-binding domain-containing protein [Alphaproteobacteria bacterium]